MLALTCLELALAVSLPFQRSCCDEVELLLLLLLYKSILPLKRCSASKMLRIPIFQV